ncbi:hypothetical protein AVS7_02470 [Acidovorax sp. MR-S7]|nr:hypothetical protein AVS7_02470 [Acidovorax sp. MR-S7]
MVSLLAVPLLGMAGGAYALDLQVNHEVRYYGNATANPNDGPVGGTYTYRTSSGINDSSGSVGNAVLVQDLPDNAIFQGIDAPAGVNCTGQPAVGQPIGTATISCTFPTLSAGAPQVVDFNVILPAESTSNVASVSLTAAGNTDGNNSNHDNITRNVTTYERADLAVDITGPADGSTQQQGTVVNWTLQVSNTNSPYAYPLKAGEKAVVRFPLPAGTAWQNSPSGIGWSCAQSIDNSASPPVSVQTCEYTASGAGIAKGANLPLLTIPVTVTASTGNTNALVSVAGQTSGGASFIDADPDNNNDTSGIVFAPNTQLDMRLRKSVSPSTLDKEGAATQSVVYRLQVDRLSGGMTPTGPFTITDTLPAGVTFNGVTAASATAGWACTGSISCTFTGTVNGDSSLPDLNFNADVNVGAVTVDSTSGVFNIPNTATLSVGNEPAGNLGNNTSTATLTVSNRASLSTDKYPAALATGGTGIGAIADGTNFFWRIGIRNNGQVDVQTDQTITVTDTLDPKLEYVAVPGAPAPWSCSANMPWTAGMNPGQTVTCTLNAGTGIAVGQTLYLHLPVKAHIPGGSQWASISNSATVGCPTDRNCVPGGFLTNSSSVNLSDKKADLSIQKDAAITPNSVPALLPAGSTDASGSEVVYTLRFKNALPSPMPGGMTPADFQTAQTVTVTDDVINLLNRDVSPAADPVTGAPRYTNNRFVIAEVDASNFPTGDSNATPPIPAMMTTGCSYADQGSGSTTRVTCTFSNVPVSDTEYVIRIRARQFVNPQGNGTQSNTIDNTASIDSEDTAEYTGTGALPNSNDAQVTLTPLTNLIAGKTAAPVAALAGQPVTYTLTADNRGPSQATNVTVVDTLPLDMIWVTAPSSGPTCSLSDGATIAAGLVVTAANRDMTCVWPGATNRGAVRSLTYTLRSANTGYQASVFNEARVSTVTPETTLADNLTDQTVTLSQPQLNVLINMQHTADRLPINQGAASRTQYTIRVQNSGNSTSYATNVVMEDLFPAPGSTAVFALNGATVTGVRALAPNDSPVIPNRFGPSNCAFSASGLRCDFPWLAPGESAEITFEMDATGIDNNGLPYGTIRHEASVRADGERLPSGDVMADNTVSDRTSAYDASQINPADLRVVDLSITKTTPNLAPGDSVRVGDTIAYRLTVRNEETATPPNHLVNGNAMVRDELPAGLELVLPAPAGCTYAARTLECGPIVNLNQGATRTYDFNVTVAATNAASLRNVATVTSPGDPVDPNNENGIDVPVENIDVGLVKSVDRASASVGNTLTYTLAVTNNGSAPNSAAVITDSLPAGVTFVASASGCTAAGSTVTCNVGALAVSQTKTFTFTVTVNPSVAPGTRLLNTASVTTPGDRDPTNNEDDAETEVVVPQPIPTLSEWGLIALSMLLAAFALRRMPLQPGRRM